jgi:DAACS family dicarboxylate/amino acid:cation (Na+ or H+) symporter
MTASATLTRAILIAMALGALTGLGLSALPENATVHTWLTDGLFEVLGGLFVAALKMLVVPLVFVSLVVGVTAFGSPTELGRLSLKTIGLYLVTTAIAVSLALTLALAVGPGEGFEAGEAPSEFTGRDAPPLTETLTGLVPENIARAMAEGEMLQVIVFALLFGVAVAMTGERGQHVLNVFRDLDAVLLQMVQLVIRVAPVGVFALIAQTFAAQGLDVLRPLLGYFLTLSGALLLQAIVIYPLLLRALAGLPIRPFLGKMRDPATFAFATASSAATIPVTLRTVESRLGVDNRVASFTVPLGATLNMDGTAMMQGVATVFIANAYGIALGVPDLVAVVATATLASIGTAAVPGVGLVMLTLVLGQVGLPVEGIALIIGVDRLLDMLRTACNVTGDGAVTAIVAKSEAALDPEVFADPRAAIAPTFLDTEAPAEPRAPDG